MLSNRARVLLSYTRSGKANHTIITAIRLEAKVFLSTSTMERLPSKLSTRSGTNRK